MKIMKIGLKRRSVSFFFFKTLQYAICCMDILYESFAFFYLFAYSFARSIDCFFIFKFFRTPQYYNEDVNH